jgi:hypothetical protein
MERFRSHETAAHELLGERLTSLTGGLPPVQDVGQPWVESALDRPFLRPACPTDTEVLIAALRRRVPARALIIGDNAAVARVLAEVQKYCGRPLYDCRSGRDFLLPVDGGTVVLHDVSTLRVQEQLRMSAWMTESGSGCSVVATSAEPLFPAVTSGTFLPALFYRLNVVTIECARLSPR